MQPTTVSQSAGANKSTLVSSSKTLAANNATANVPIFRVTGDVEVVRLWGVVTTALSSAITAAFWRLNDQTAQVAISLATGTTLSSFAIGSLLVRSSVASVALTGDNASAGKVRDPVAATAPAPFMPFIVAQKTGGVQTDIEFTYSTTNTPATGAIQFFAEYIPRSAGAKLVAV